MAGILKNNAFVFRTFYNFLDPLVIFAGTFLFYYLFQSHVSQYRELIKIFAVYGSLFVLLVFSLLGMYRSWRGESLYAEFKAIALAWSLVLLAFNAFILLVANEQQLAILWPYSLLKVKVFWAWAVFCLLLLTFVRFLGRSFFRIIRKMGYNQRTAVIVGAGDVGQRVCEYLEEHPWMGIQVLGFFDDRATGRGDIPEGYLANQNLLGSIEGCIPVIREKKPDFVIIALPARAAKKIDELIFKLGTSGTNILMVPDLFSFGLQKAKLQHLGNIPIMVFNLFPVWKRVFDLLFSFTVLFVLSPLFLLLALCIKLQDKGPVFYSHRRIGETGEPFGCLKFRTMSVNADQKLKEILEKDPEARKEWEKTYKLKKDPRITALGRFLRKTSLDELPQFINVIKGEMSVVGARPVVNDELHTFYQKNAVAYCSMKPGVTGPWQIGKRSDTENYLERVNLDHWYVVHSSIWLDLKIIFLTILKVFTGKGAY